MSKYNFASQKPKIEEKIVKEYDISEPRVYKLEVEFKDHTKYYYYNPHTSEFLNEDKTPVSLDRLNSYYEPKKYRDWTPNSPSNPAKKHDHPSSVKIKMGLKCNYQCSYCNQASFVPNSIQGNPKDAELFLEKLDTWYKGDGNKTRWEFWGGEPLVYIKVLKVLVEGLRKRFPDAEFNMISNASMLTKETVDWIDEMGIQLGISHDGAVYTDQRGEDVLCNPKTLEMIKYAYHKLFPKNRIGFNCVLTVKNYSMSDVRTYIADKLGVKPFDIPLTTEEVMLPYDSGGMMLSPTTEKEYKNLFETIFREVASTELMGVSSVFEKLDDFFKSIIHKRPYTAFGQKCGMDDPHIISVDLKGNSMTCQNVNSQLENHYTGNLYEEGGTDNLSMKLVHHFRTRPECVRCPVVQMCKGACLFLENHYWKKACDVSYVYNIAMLAVAVNFITGGLLKNIIGIPRRDTMEAIMPVITDAFKKELFNNNQQ